MLPSVSFFQSTVCIGNAYWCLKPSSIFQRARDLPTVSMLLVGESLKLYWFKKKLSVCLVVLVDDVDISKDQWFKRSQIDHQVFPIYVRLTMCKWMTTGRSSLIWLA